MVIGLGGGGGGSRPSVSQDSNEGIGDGGDSTKSILALVAILVAFFLLLYLLG